MTTRKFNWTEEQLKAQFHYAEREGWLPHIQEFATMYDIPAARILAIASRETNMRNIKGDYSQRKGETRKRYHGFGVMQVDVNTNPDFCQWWDSEPDKRKSVRISIEQGVKILKSKYRYLANKRLLEPTLTRYAIAAYNGGERRAYDAYIAGKDANTITTGKNYQADVAAREVVFQKFLARL